MKETRTLLRQDPQYLRCIVAKVIEISPSEILEDRDTLGVLQDYLVWITVDAMSDEELARRLVKTLAKLQEELHTEAESRHACDLDTPSYAFYEGFLHGLEQAVSFRHGVDLLLDEEMDRGEFTEAWEQTRERLGL
jgi:hypothetical protein